MDKRGIILGAEGQLGFCLNCQQKAAVHSLSCPSARHLAIVDGGPLFWRPGMENSSLLWSICRPNHFFEKDIQNAVEEFACYLFPGYVVVKRGQMGMPQGWQPDTVLMSRHGVIIIEFKGSPPSSNQQGAVNQVACYGKALSKQYNGTIRLLVIGPWKFENRIYMEYWDSDHNPPLEVGYIPIEFIAEELLFIAERLLLEHQKVLSVFNIPSELPISSDRRFEIESTPENEAVQEGV